MSIYEKILISTFSSFAKTNKLNPVWSAIGGLSVLHVFNFLNIGILSGFTIDGMEKMKFVLVFSALTVIVMWIQYKRYLKGESFAKRAKQMASKTKFWFGLGSLIYSLTTFGIFFWTQGASWQPFTILCIIFIGVSLSGYLFERKN